MKRFIKRLLAVSVLALLATTAWASGPNEYRCPANPLCGFFLGVEGGGDIILANERLTSTDRNEGTTFIEPLEEGIFSGAGAYGVAMGYSIPFSYGKYAIEPSFDFNQLNGSAESYNLLNGATIALKSTIKPEQQYNFWFALKRLIGKSFTLNFNFGASVLSTTVKLQSENSSSAVTLNTSSFENKALFWGPVLGIGLQYWLSHHSTILFNFNNTFYFTRQLPDQTNVSSGDTIISHTVQNRKIYIYLPSFILRYSYYFN